MTCRCKCGWPVYTDRFIVLRCPRCGDEIRCTGSELAPVPTVAVVRLPVWAKLLSCFSISSDRGVGDTFHRIATLCGGQVYKRWLARNGKTCGCNARHHHWNRLYPYHRPAKLAKLDILVVTSISPLERHRSSQTIALDSWKAFGLTIASMNTGDEIAAMRRLYPQVSEWLRQDQEVHWGRGRRSQLVRNLMRVAIDRDRPIWVINSDIEITGSLRTLLEHQPDQRLTLGVRWDYERRHSDATEFQWGFDVIGITPEHASKLPESFRFGIGQPVWDYAAPMLMSEHYKMIHEPIFFHKNHPLNWDEKAWNEGAEMFAQHFGDTITNERTAYWRQRFEPDMVYDVEQYRYVRRTDS